MPHNRPGTRVITTFLLLFQILSLNGVNVPRIKRQGLFFDRVSSTSDVCYTKEGDEGECIEATNCQQARDILAKVPSPEERELLRQRTCRIVGTIPYFCCLLPTSDPPLPIQTRSGSTIQASQVINTTTTTTTTTGQSLLDLIDLRLGGDLNKGMSLSELQKVCGVSRELLAPKILDPTRAIANAWKWTVAIFLGREGATNLVEVDCDGVLISDLFVLTSAQCVFEKDQPEVRRSLSEFLVRLGDLAIHTDLDNVNPIDFNISSVIPHPAYSQNPTKNDIALLRLSKPVDFSKSIAPICLPTEEFEPQNLQGVKAYTSFWKKSVGAGGSPETFLVQAPLDVQNNTECQALYKPFGVSIHDQQLCAEYKGSDELKCQSGKGEPMMAQWKDTWYLIGTASTRQSCLQPGLPGIYSRISEYRDWILENAKLK